MSKTSLVCYLNEVPDTRRAEGQRHNHTFVLLTVLMSTMSGYIGYRAIGDFIKRNKSDLLKYFQPNKDRLPTFDTVRRILINLDFVAFSKQFHEWAVQYIGIEEDEWVSLDGKALRGTVTNSQDEKQHFISLVSLYCSKRKLIIGNGRLYNSKESEIPLVQKLISDLDIEGLVFTLDALHCQKKQQKSLKKVEMIM